MRSGRAADSFGASRLVLGTDLPNESGAIFERTVTVTYIKTSGPCPGYAGPACWDGKDGQLDWPAGDSGAQPLTGLLLSPSKITR